MHQKPASASAPSSRATLVAGRWRNASTENPISTSMKIAVVGHGRLAMELLAELGSAEGLTLEPWDGDAVSEGTAIVVHAGSGRELDQVMKFCERTQTTLLELATGSILENLVPAFPVVLCPNTNILMLKFMNLIASSGSQFRGYQVSLQESHQSRKTSVPGTAHAIARSLGLPAESIHSERDPQRQMIDFAVPAEHLDRHAVHRICVSDGACTVHLEARVLGEAPYARGVGHLLRALESRRLAPGLHRVEQFVRDGWL